MPTSRAALSSRQAASARASGSGRSTWNTLGSTVSWWVEVIGFSPGTMGTVMPSARAALDKVEVLLVVEEHLGYHIRGTGIDFGFEVSQVGFGVGGLVVFLGVAGHTVGEGRGEGHVRPVEKVSLVEAVDLLLQVDGVGVSLGRGGEAGLVFGLVAPQNEQVGNAQEVEVDKGIFGLTSGKTAAYQVWNGGYMILVLYGGSYGYGAGAALFRYPLVKAVVGSLVDKFAPV